MITVDELLDKFMDNEEYPFKKLFKHLPPQDFVYLFKDEQVQVMAFVLSFCRNKSFVRKVTDLIKNRDVVNTIYLYLNNCSKDYYDKAFVDYISSFVNVLLELYQRPNVYTIMRSTLKEIIPLHVVKEGIIVAEIKSEMESTLEYVKNIYQAVNMYCRSIKNTTEQKKPERVPDPGEALTQTEIDELLAGT